MKKILVLAIMATLTVGLVGCGGTTNTADNASEVVEETTTEETVEETTEETVEDVAEEETELEEEVEETISYAGFYTVTFPEGYDINDNNDRISNSVYSINIRTYKSEVEKEKEKCIGYGYTDAGVMTFNGIDWTVVTDDKGAFLWVESGDAIVEVQAGLPIDDDAVQTILNSLTITAENTYEANQEFYANK